MSHSDPALAMPVTPSSLAVSGIGGGNATVTWTTDQACSSRVVYGLASKGQPDQTTPEQDGVGTLVTSHSVALSGLQTGKAYVIRAISRLNSGKDGLNLTKMNGHTFELAGAFVA